MLDSTYHMSGLQISGLQILMHGILSLRDATSYDNYYLWL